MHTYHEEVKAFLKNYIRNYRAGLEDETPQKEVAEQLRISVRAYQDLERGIHGMASTTLMFFLAELPDESIIDIIHEFRSYIKNIEQQKDDI